MKKSDTIAGAIHAIAVMAMLRTILWRASIFHPPVFLTIFCSGAVVFVLYRANHAYSRKASDFERSKRVFPAPELAGSQRHIVGRGHAMAAMLVAVPILQTAYLCYMVDRAIVTPPILPVLECGFATILAINIFERPKAVAGGQPATVPGLRRFIGTSAIMAALFALGVIAVNYGVRLVDAGIVMFGLFCVDMVFAAASRLCIRGIVRGVTSA